MPETEPEVEIEITEHHGSRRFVEGKSAERVFHIRGTTDEAVAMQTLKAATADPYQGIKRSEVQIEEIFYVEDNPSACIWRGNVRYQNNPRNNSDVDHPTEYGFDTSGGTQHISQAISHVATYVKDGYGTPDHKGAIAVTPDGVQGCDVTVPVFSHYEAHYIEMVNLTEAYQGILYELTGTVNNATFRGRDPGECLFMGATASWTEDDDGAMVRFNFLTSKNFTNLTVGDLTNIAKKGWEYLWTEYDQAKDTSGKRLVTFPIAVHIEQVYRYGIWSNLNI